MCFSATSSFTAAIVLLSVSVVSLTRLTNKRALLLSLMPFLFAIQQATEGTLWLALTKDQFSFLASAASIIFLFFALILWPIWPSLALLTVEPKAQQKKLLMAWSGMGICLAIYNFYILFFHPVSATIVQDSIFYNFHTPFPNLYNFYLACYTTLVAGPFFISSLRFTKVVGLAIITSLFLAFIIKEATFGSVWCFFAALLSTLILFVLHKNKLQN